MKNWLINFSCVIFGQKACIALKVILCPQTKLHMMYPGPLCSNFAAENVDMFLMHSQEQSFPERITPAAYWCLSCVELRREHPQNIWPRNLRSTEETFLSGDTNCKRSWKSAFPPSVLPDVTVEVDEMYQNAGEKGIPHLDPEDPPRRRANKARGHGTWDSDRPPVFGTVGRQSGKVSLSVEHTNDSTTCSKVVEETTQEQAHVYTDEWKGYNKMAAETERTRTAVSHSGPKSTYALDLDGDGVREAHINTMEGFWTSLRNFLRRFRGVSKHYLQQYVRTFLWGYNLKRLTSEFLQAMLLSNFTYLPT